MATLTKQNPIPKVIALVAVTIFVALLMSRFDVNSLAKLDSMSPSEVVVHQRELHQHSFIYHFIATLMMGGFFLGVIEFLAYVIGLPFKKSDM